MSQSLQLKSFNHMNQVVPDCQRAISFYRETFGAQLLWTMGPHPSAEACLMNFGGAVFEYVSPRIPRLEVPPPMHRRSRFGGRRTRRVHQWLCGERRALLRCGVRVDHLRGSLQLVKEQGLRVLDQIRWRYSLTYADECHGVSFEIYDRDWYSVPSPRIYREEMKRASYWRDEHPLGVAGFRYTIAVESLDAAAQFYKDFCGADARMPKRAPAEGVQEVVLTLGDTSVTLMSSSSGGQVRDFLDRNGEGIYSMVFAVEDLSRVSPYFSSKGIQLIPGTTPGSVAVPTESNFGVLYEFEELRSG